MRLGFASDDLSCAIDLGLPTMGPFPLDPVIKTEVVCLRPAEVRGSVLVVAAA